MDYVTSVSRAAGLLAAALLVHAMPASAEVVGEDAAACSNPQLATVLVRIGGFRNGLGTVRVQAYGPRAQDFLVKGKWVRRIEVPLNGRRSLDVCLRLPQPGQYGIAVRHDANVNGKSDWNDGGGFSRNPRLSLFSLKPDWRAVAIPVGRGNQSINVVMNYRHGLTISPIG